MPAAVVSPSHSMPSPRPTRFDVTNSVTDSRFVRAVLLEADRLVVTFALSGAVFLFLLVAGVLWPFEMQDLLTETRAVQTLFNTLLSGTILLVSIVVSINSIVISQELGPLRSQYDRIDDTLAFQSEVEEFAAAGISPRNPSSSSRSSSGRSARTRRR